MRSVATPRLAGILAATALVTGMSASTVAANTVPVSGPFTMVSAASYQGPVARGSIAAVFGTNLTTEPARTFDPGVEVTPGGVSVTIDACRNRALVKRLPILFVSASQLNVYIPNPDGYEPYGTCRDTGNDMVTVHTSSGQDITQPQPMPRTAPGVFMAGGAGPTPEGW